ncbi:MAG TPA: hypothetical protein VFD91_09240 [Mariniphaga sp.]|nr:hypothetical protein [Mariniphaga sp.]
MEKKFQHQIIIKTSNENSKQKFPLNLMIMLAMGTITGVIFIFGLFLGLELIAGL